MEGLRNLHPAKRPCRAALLLIEEPGIGMPVRAGGRIKPRIAKKILNRRGFACEKSQEHNKADVLHHKRDLARCSNQLNFFIPSNLTGYATPIG